MSNTYMGLNATAGVPVTGDVNEDLEILMNVYATSYDALDSIMLTDQENVYDPTTVNEVKGRFLAIRRVVSNNNPALMPVIDKLEDLAIKKAEGKISNRYFYNKTKKIIRESGVSNRLIDIIEQKIDQAQHKKNGQRGMFNFGNMFHSGKNNNSNPVSHNPLLDGDFFNNNTNNKNKKIKNKKTGKKQSNPLMDGSMFQMFFNQKKNKKQKNRPGRSPSSSHNPLMDGSMFQSFFNQNSNNNANKKQNKEKKPVGLLDLLNNTPLVRRENNNRRGKNRNQHPPSLLDLLNNNIFAGPGKQKKQNRKKRKKKPESIIELIGGF